MFYNNKKNNFFLILPVIALSFASCEKVVDLKLNDAEKKYVIEANITDKPGSCKVLLSKSKNFNENNQAQAVSNAIITIADNNGTPAILIETSSGVYELPTLTGMQNHTYTLSVKVDGQSFSAVCSMPSAVPFDSLTIAERTFFGETNKYATVNYTDPAGVQNAYRFIQYVNGVKEKTLFIRDDNSSDGKIIVRPLIFFYDEKEKDKKALKAGDTVRVEMLSISYPIYKYWYSLSESATGSSQSTTPGNPVTNVTGGALGYFSAHTIQEKTIVVP